MERLHSISDLVVKLSVAIKNIMPLLLALIFNSGCVA